MFRKLFSYQAAAHRLKVVYQLGQLNLRHGFKRYMQMVRFALDLHDLTLPSLFKYIPGNLFQPFIYLGINAFMSVFRHYNQMILQPVNGVSVLFIIQPYLLDN